MTTLLKDVIDIPRRAGEEDYVLRLTDNVGGGAASALQQYVVTPDIADSFDQALGLVAEAIGSDTSRGAFLAGSFGSGKSHFMAVLHALLRQDPDARTKEGLQSVVAQHDPALRDTNVLPLAFHLLGAESLEQAIFEGYIRQIRELHPTAPMPAVHESDQLLADAENLRCSMGDAPFFRALGGGDDVADDEWGAVLGSATWDAERYDRARAATPDTEERQQLVSALVERFFSAYTRQATYLDVDTGLAAVSAHAKGLGYDAVVLFLDELVLWLAFAVQDQSFFRRESQKITKLVESGTGRRAIPLVSFVARQMDLRRWFADSGAAGADQEALDRAFRHQEGRFSIVQLGDDNLPHVARQRLLRRKDDRAEQVMTEAFEQLERRPEVWDVLLDGVNTDDSHRGADEAAFKLTYPFSPALISTLRSLAGVMQRERTALKVMQQMLVDRRETLTVNDVIPVGDAFEYIVNGESPLDPTSAALFRSARTLDAEKIRPLLLQTHQLHASDLEAAERGDAELPLGYRADVRLAQTLLLAAIAPKVPALRNVTASRLASLNHGSIISPLPGNERNVVAGKVRQWSRSVPEIRMTDDSRDPVISVQLDDVDYESIVENAKGEHNAGRSRELVKDLLAEMLGIELGAPDMFGVHQHQVVWRGSRREVDLVFGNVRDASWLTEDHFTHRPGTWRVVIDHPFDDEGRSSAEDVARLDVLLAAGTTRQTVVWLPRFLSSDKMSELRRLVILDWLLGGTTNERWDSHANHLSETARVTAKAILQGQHASLREGLIRALEVAYGLGTSAPGIVVDGDGHDRLLTSLDRAYDPGTPDGVTLAAAFGSIVDGGFSTSYPAHPRFEPEDRPVTEGELRTVADHVSRAAADPDHRVPLEGDVAAVRRVAGALGAGTAAETHFIFDDGRFAPWSVELARAIGRAGIESSDPVTVGRLRGWIEEIEPRVGLRREVADLVIIGWALLRQRAWYHHGGAIDAPRPGKLQDAMELRSLPMPMPGEWSSAISAAGALFGITASAFLTPDAMARLTGSVQGQATELAGPAARLVEELEAAYRRLDVGDGSERTSDRLATARESAEVVSALKQLDGVPLVQRLAEVDAGGRAVMLGASLRSAESTSRSLSSFRWQLTESLLDTDDGAGQAILGRLRNGVVAEEHATRLAPVLDAAADDTIEWLQSIRTPPAVPRPAERESEQGLPTDPPTRAGDVELPETGPTPGTDRGAVVVHRGHDHEATVQELRAFLAGHPDDTVEVTWRVLP